MTTTTTIPTFDLAGTVMSSEGVPLGGAVVSVGGETAVTGADGTFLVAGVPGGPVSVTRPAWEGLDFEWDGNSPLDMLLEPFAVRGLRFSRYNSMDEDGLGAMLELVEGTVVNTIVFDTKDETGGVLYNSQVDKAVDLGATEDVYDPLAAIERVHEAGLYAITRIVAFEDPVWTNADQEARLAGRWVDARNPANWEYPLDLAVEACELGFDEIQFDYVRFPAGITAEAAPPTTQDERVATIAAFLAEARQRLHPLGCAVSADVFGIVSTSPSDEGIGQRPEETSASVDALSPMVYPSHYSPGHLGFTDPNDHPGPVTADALDGAGSRLADGALLRPWLQAFYYNATQVQAAISEAEARGMGWMLWNAAGNYSKSWLPLADG